MNCWVASKLEHGLGNRLFQLAVAHKLSEEWSLPLVFAMPFCKTTEHGPLDSIFKLFPTVPKLSVADPHVAIDQKGCFTYSSFPTVAPGKCVLLRGYWQVANYVLDSFKPSWGFIEDSDALLEKWGLSKKEDIENTVFIHVRLGDFKYYQNHDINLFSYFVKAMAEFPSDTRFLIFSDEPDIASTYTFFSNCTIVDEPDELRALFLMSRCGRGAITANSTFSWWGAFFGRQNLDDKANYKACMPALWLTNFHEPVDSIYPEWATLLDV